MNECRKVWSGLFADHRVRSLAIKYNAELRSVGKNFGRTLSRLWTKVNEILGHCGTPCTYQRPCLDEAHMCSVRRSDNYSSKPCLTVPHAFYFIVSNLPTIVFLLKVL